jgi:predicted short-subunit dehydrogenase-like oxidoreductase (DUF2520 family)
MSISKIVLIGAGRVATQLGKALKDTGKEIIQVYSPTNDSAEKLATLLEAKPATDISNLFVNADLYLISVADDAILQIAKSLKVDGKTVAHTSGSVPLDILEQVSGFHGVFYPLNTFSKRKKIDLKKTPFFIEAGDKNTEAQLSELAKKISDDVRTINSQQRATIHIAAVFACNFTNFMFVNAAEILKNEGLPFDIMLPLIAETADKLKTIDPIHAQTGPALRNDLDVLSKHIEMLKNDADRQRLYDMISGQIREFFNEKNKKHN